MNLKTLLKELGLTAEVPETEITFITERLQDVVPGTLFAAVEGLNYDGNEFIDEAFSKGACAVITEKQFSDERIIRVRDVRLALSFLCSAFYGHPQDRLKIIGITGTNGKTTTAEYFSHILDFTGRKCGIIGTLGCRIAENNIETGYTTPSGDVLFRTLRDMADAGCEYCVMEVSSQALAQKRVDPIVFSTAVITNIGTDHIDYHGSFENYVNEKKRLLDLSVTSLINADDAYCEEFENAAGKNKCYLYSAKGGLADFMAKNIRFSDREISYIILNGTDMESFRFGGIGMFPVYNTLAAASAAYLEGVAFNESARALKTLPQIRGRASHYSKDGINAYIDFAHTPEALSGMLRTLKNQYSGKLICVFGCGGDRDKSKRSEMGRIASLYADSVVITSDNPRGENQADIASDILSGIKNRTSVFTEPDREKAIALAINKASPGDTVLVAGKGHEEYQISGDTKIHFSDESTVKKLLGV